MPMCKPAMVRLTDEHKLGLAEGRNLILFFSDPVVCEWWGCEYPMGEWN